MLSNAARERYGQAAYEGAVRYAFDPANKDRLAGDPVQWDAVAAAVIAAYRADLAATINERRRVARRNLKAAADAVSAARCTGRMLAYADVLVLLMRGADDAGNR